MVYIILTDIGYPSDVSHNEGKILGVYNSYMDAEAATEPHLADKAYWYDHTPTYYWKDEDGTEHWLCIVPFQIGKAQS